MRSTLRRLPAACEAAAAVEFAMVGPLVILAFTAAFSGFTLHSGAVALETGAAAASRRAVLGEEAIGGLDRTAEIRRVITRFTCPSETPGAADCYWSKSVDIESDDGALEPLGIRLRAYVDPRNFGRPEPFVDANVNGTYDAGEEFTDVNGNGRWDADRGRAEPGGSGDHVLYNILMAQDVRHPLLRTFLGETVTHNARLVVRNEPY